MDHWPLRWPVCEEFSANHNTLACPLVISYGYCGGIYETHEVITSLTCKHIMEYAKRRTVSWFCAEVKVIGIQGAKNITFIGAAVHEQLIVV